MKRLLLVALGGLVACASPEGRGLAPSGAGSGAQVKFDVFHRPLPEIPLPNDFATRFDASSPTKRRINASMLAPSKWERATREALDQLDGWGTYQTISVGFEAPLDLLNIVKRHQGDDYAPHDDVAYLLDVSRDSPDFCQRVPLDLGEGNFPLVLERPEYFPNDRPGEQLLFEDREEDLNRNGRLDPGEDLDMDGVLDHPNTLTPGDSPFDVMTFYERETNTLLLKPVLPLRERTTYAVVLTKRLVDETGRPVRSPFTWVNHVSQTNQLAALPECLANFGLGVEDIAFTWAYSTQSITNDYVAVRDGLYGLGTMQRLATQYPAEVSKILALRDAAGPGTQVSARVVRSDEFQAAAAAALKSLGSGALSPTHEKVMESHKFIDFHVVFQFVSPQFFPREDAEGNRLPLYRQLIDLNAETGAAYTRPETVTVWLTVPKARPAAGPAPLVILGHGYTGNKLDPLYYGGYFARYGLATVGMENVSHGASLTPTDYQLARALFAGQGLGNMFDALLGTDRSFDWNRDGVPDSAPDFWSANIMHSRDLVKQSALDYMQFIRVIRAFDGVKTWSYDNNRDGVGDLAGDFDGDGRVDVGGTAPINMTGGSLGGIMSGMMAGLEPQLDVAVPVAGGGGFPDIGMRSTQGGVQEEVNLRLLGPLFLSLRNKAGDLEAWQYLPNLNRLGAVNLGKVEVPLAEGDTVVLTNLTSGEYRCARVGAGGLLRAAVSSDEGDLLKAEVFAGPLPPQARTGCVVPEGMSPYWVKETFGVSGTFQGLPYEAGAPLRALGDGFGLRRQSPELRRFLNLAQLAVEKGDPINFAPNIERHRVLRYGTGEEVSTRMISVTTIGDSAVPVATGVAMARAAGFVELFSPDPRYGKTENRVLIDTDTLAGVERMGRHLDGAGRNAHVDLDHYALLSGSGNKDQFDVPRLGPPLRLVRPSERVGGFTGVMFPMVEATGAHGFDLPNPEAPFNLGALMLNVLGRYMQTGGTEFPLEACAETSTCSWVPPVPVE